MAFAAEKVERQLRQRRIPVCDYVYRLADGEEWFRRRRFRLVPPMPNKTKDIVYLWLRTPYDIRWEKRDGADGLVYRLPELLMAKEYGETVWWAEGEKDADNLTAAGVVATSHHGGAGKITAEQVAWFRGHRGLINLLMDSDEDDKRGGNVGAFDVVRRYDLLRAVGIEPWQVRVGHALIGKDVSDHLAAGHGLDALVWLDDLSELRVKAALTKLGAFGGAGYGDPMPPDWGSRFNQAGDCDE